MTKDEGDIRIDWVEPTDLEGELLRWDNLIVLHPSDPQGYIQRGMVKFKLGLLEDAIADFDRAEHLDSKIAPYLWQRGLAYYYAERYEEGAKQFELDLTVNDRDGEETVWRYLCIARSQGVEAAKNSLLPVRNDPRLVMGQVYELFAGNASPEDVLATGNSEGRGGKFYSRLYVGLYWEAQGDEAQGKQYIVEAVSQYPLDDYMWYLAWNHCHWRGWQKGGF